MKQIMSGDIKVISKTIPIQVTPVNNNSGPVDRGETIIHQMRQIITFESLIGINRLYLLNHRRIIRWLDHLLSALLMSVIVYYVVSESSSTTASYTVIVDTTCAEYLSLVIMTMLTRKSSFRNLFSDMAAFDHLMNLSDDLETTSPSARSWAWVAASVLYSLVEFITLTLFLTEITDYWYTLTYVTLILHDCEQIFFCSLLRMILIRVYIIKAHVEKTFSINTREAKRKLNKVEALSKKAQLDISSLHRNYELLHKCSEQLNSLMSLPMMIMLFCSGLSTTVLLRNIFKTLQSADESKGSVRNIAYATSRCVRYTILVIVPCYFSSVTTTQVSYIRTMLHDAMNQPHIGKVERRRVKAFFQLTRENEFAYALWGVIRLNMSLPLSYLSLCTTYLVIIIQFSKFID